VKYGLYADKIKFVRQCLMGNASTDYNRYPIGILETET
jgi:hypothetical protein